MAFPAATDVTIQAIHPKFGDLPPELLRVITPAHGSALGRIQASLPERILAASSTNSRAPRRTPGSVT